MQVTDEMIEAGKDALLTTFRNEPDFRVQFIYLAMRAAKPIHDGTGAGVWQNIASLNRDAMPFTPVLVSGAFGVSVATSGYGMTGVGSATHWMPLPALSRQSVDTDRGGE